MVTCKDCIQNDVCEYADAVEYPDEELIKPDCPRFKNKAKFVEVVRCKDCIYGRIRACAITGAETLFCEYGIKPIAVEPMHYCSYGKRKENEDD